jgi:hypothetical protein
MESARPPKCPGFPTLRRDEGSLKASTHRKVFSTGSFASNPKQTVGSFLAFLHRVSTQRVTR